MYSNIINAYQLTDCRHMLDLVLFVLMEEGRICSEIQGKNVSVVFDGTSRLGEAVAILVHFVGEEWRLEQRLICLQMVAKSMTAEKITRELISVLCEVQCAF